MIASMDLGILSPEELAVLDAIIEQRSESLTDWFKYDYMRAQKYLAEKGFFIKYGIDLHEQIAIAERLSDRNIIHMGGIGGREKRKPGESKIYWGSPMEWVNECAELARREGPGISYLQQHYKIFMRMSLDTVQAINNEYKTSHTIQLRMNKLIPCLDIKIDQDAWLHLERMDDSGTPISVLRHAYKRHDKIITRAYLQKANINIGNKYLRSQVFEKNRTVQALNSLSLKINKDSIVFSTKPIQLTAARLKKLKQELKIS